jgi:hypothetical protein
MSGKESALARRLLDKLLKGEALNGLQMLFLYRHADEAEIKRAQAEAWRRRGRR